MSQIIPITMPKFGLSMTEGKVASWLVEEGQAVKRGAEIADIETSKITNAYESPVTGKLRRHVTDIGIDLPVGALIAVFADDSVSDEEIDAFIQKQQAEFSELQAAAEAEGGGPEPQKVAIGDLEVRYLETGNPEGDAVILVHGFGGDLNNWLFTQPALSENYRVLAIDLPGHGGSSKSVDAGTVDAFAGSLLSFMSALDISSAHLVGHSLGGGIIVKAAALDPGRVASLSLIAPVGFGREINRDFIQGFIGADRRKSLQPVLGKLFADPQLVSRDMVDNILKFKRLDGAIASLEQIAAANFDDASQRTELSEALAALDVPTQAFWGEEDQIIPVAHAGALPDRVEVHRFSNVGHMPHLEAAAAVNEQLERFFAASKAG